MYPMIMLCWHPTHTAVEEEQDLLSDLQLASVLQFHQRLNLLLWCFLNTLLGLGVACESGHAADAR